MNKYIWFKTPDSGYQFIVQLGSKRYWFIINSNNKCSMHYLPNKVKSILIDQWLRYGYEIIKKYDSDEDFLKDWFSMLLK